MYRHNERPPSPKALIEYRSHWVRPWFIVLGLLIFAIGLASLTAIHATRMTCARLGDEPGSCHARRYGLFRGLDLTLGAEEITSFDVAVRTGSKGAKYAVVRLRTKAADAAFVELESGRWGHVDPAQAFAAAAEWREFDSGRTKTMDAWLTVGPLGSLFTVLFGVGLAAVAIAMLREQLEQLRPIRVLVEPDRERVVVGRHVIPIREIDDVKVEHGRALFWSSNKHERVPGHRLVLVRRHRTPIPVTRAYRAGPRDAHELARKQLLHALGRQAQ